MNRVRQLSVIIHRGCLEVIRNPGMVSLRTDTDCPPAGVAGVSTFLTDVSGATGCRQLNLLQEPIIQLRKSINNVAMLCVWLDNVQDWKTKDIAVEYTTIV